MLDPNRIPTLSVTEAHQALGPATDTTDVDRPLLVDVREPGEIEEVRAEGVVVMPLSTFMARHDELPRDRPLLMICRTGARSGQATGFLLAKGWTDVSNVAGGTLAWLQAGLPVRRGPLADGEGDLPS
ncbi:MAG: rhodanese-like domain-containing protein [Chloroflexota bacterium]|nr:MAG: rhodanese-like domain-containing protein [Chloroflexota bacterium]